MCSVYTLINLNKITNLLDGWFFGNISFSMRFVKIANKVK